MISQVGEWALSKREVLFVSSHNPGGRQVADSIRHCYEAAKDPLAAALVITDVLPRKLRVRAPATSHRSLFINQITHFATSRRNSHEQMEAVAENSTADLQEGTVVRRSNQRSVSGSDPSTSSVPTSRVSRSSKKSKAERSSWHGLHVMRLSERNSVASSASGNSALTDVEDTTSQQRGVDCEASLSQVIENIEDSMLAKPEDAATRMLIVLNQHSFEGQTGDELSKDVRRAMKLNLPITLVHLPELPGQSSGCPFEVRRQAFITLDSSCFRRSPLLMPVPMRCSHARGPTWPMSRNPFPIRPSLPLYPCCNKVSCCCPVCVDLSRASNTVVLSQRFFSITPRDLISKGLYKQVAVPWYNTEPHLRASEALVFEALGATAKGRVRESTRRRRLAVALATASSSQDNLASSAVAMVKGIATSVGRHSGAGAPMTAGNMAGDVAGEDTVNRL